MTETNLFYDQWVEALPKYRKTKSQLRVGDAFCCLGVACDLHDPSRWRKYDRDYGYKFGEIETEYMTGFLPPEVGKRLGIQTDGGSFYMSDLPESTQQKIRKLPGCGVWTTSYSLVGINDNTDDWDLIIEVLRAKPKSLFNEQAVEL